MRLYIVHMKRVTASEARKNWFRILDEVASGEVVVIHRHGKRLILQSEKEDRRKAAIPDYTGLLHVPEAEAADQWRWEWPGPGEGLVSTGGETAE
jgi:antitoxin (DNA-binding transcriptional repressor) of toxin-antitoxin stability system